METSYSELVEAGIKFVFDPDIMPGDDTEMEIITCPGFDHNADSLFEQGALQRAVGDYYENKHCRECYLNVRYVPGTKTCTVTGQCQKK